jgi:putative transposase
LAVLSNGETFENPHALITGQRKLARLNRELARRKKDGQNWRKTKHKIQRCYARIANVRKHILHDISHHVTADLRPKTVVIENLNVSGMAKNRYLSKAIYDAGFAELRRQIEYKAQWHGVEILLADRWFASSKTCSACGCIKDDLALADRIFKCADCGTVIDRDLNAAMNLAALGELQNMQGLPRELGCSETLL